MESSLDHHDELRRLQDQVRKLQIQNEQLRSQQFPRNGFDFDIKPNILSPVSNLDHFKNRLDHSTYNWDNDFLKPEELRWENFDNEESWLYVPKNCNNSPKNLRKWLQQDINSQCDYELENVRRRLIDKVAEVEQGSPRNFIDTGTFTRPKKRVIRPGLDVMGDRPIFENQRVMDTPFKRLMAKQLSEMIDDTSMNYDYSLPSLNSPDLNVTFVETPLKRFVTKQIPEIVDDTSMNYDYSLPSFNNSVLNATFRKDSVNLNATVCKVSSETKSIIAEHSPLNSTYIKCDDEMNSEHKSTKSDRTSTLVKTNDSSPNNTCVLGRNNTFQSQTITRIRSPVLNCTFTNADNLHCHAGTGDSVADDDQLSSASDSSFSSNTRLMNVGDVQTIARLQEENLKQMTSTPKRNNSGDGVLYLSDDPVSPIKRNTRDVHQGYLSDHSDHSSVDGRSKGSVRSSPSCSPYGSTNALANDFHRPTHGVQRRDLGSVKQDILKSEPSTKITATGQRRVASGLRPPTVRSSTTRPSTAGSSNIPRPASRIPAPRVRSAYTSQHPTHKPDWMDGCY